MASNSHTVLVVEDEPFIRLMLADLLLDEGYRVVEAANVLEAIAILGREPIDTVITDIDMPGGLSGIDLANMIHAVFKRVGIIIVSGQHADCKKLPFTARFRSKPYRFDDILGLVADDLNASRTSLKQAI